MEIDKRASRDDQLFLSVFKASPIGIALEDLEGRPLFANPALCCMLGFTEEEMRSKHCVEFSPPEDAQKDWALFEQLRAGSIDHYQLEKRFFRRDGSLIRGRLSIGTSRLVVAMVEDLSERRTTRDKLLDSEANDEKLGGRLIHAQEAERTRIAQELHYYIDSLTVLAIDLDRFGQNPPASVPETRQQIGEVRHQVNDIVSNIQTLLHHLHSSKLEYLGLTAAATSFCKELSHRQKVKIDFHAKGIPQELPKEVSLCFYRVLQEALQNTVKHSGSQLFEVSLSGDANGLQLIVRDWGIGFDPAVAMKGQGVGLMSMKERMKLIDGELSIESRPQLGTTIRARVPLKEKAKSTEAS
jgi:PAS domain S-box-containing protein